MTMTSSEYRVYLAGPITGMTLDQSEDWRTYVRKKLPPNVVGLSPLRGKEHLKRQGAIKDCYEDNPLTSAKGITTRDRWDATRCDCLFVNFLEATVVSIGTVMEVAWADAARKPIVVAMKEGNVHWHAMIRQSAGFIVPSLDDGINVIATLFAS